MRLSESDLSQGIPYCLHRLAASGGQSTGYGGGSAAAHSFGTRRENPQSFAILQEACSVFPDIQSGVGGTEMLDCNAFLVHVDRMNLHGVEIIKFYRAMPIDDSDLRQKAFSVCVLASKHARFDSQAVDDFLQSTPDQRREILRAIVQTLGAALKPEIADTLCGMLAGNTPITPPVATGAAASRVQPRP